MKKFALCLAMLSFSFWINGCRPKTDPAPTSSSSLSNNTTPQGKQTDDQSRVNDATNHGADEANQALSGDASIGGARVEQGMVTGTVCGAVISTVAGDNMSRLVTFNGVSCSGRYSRTGTAKITLIAAATGGKWKDAGSKLSIVYTNLKITDLSDGISITLNGTQTITNIFGFNWFSYLSGADIQDKIRGSYEVTFFDGSKRVWNEAKRRTTNINIYTSSYKHTVSGDTTIQSYSNVSDWGTNRNNDSFVTSLSEPLTVQNCTTTKWKFTSGVAYHYIPQGTITVLFSSNAQGQNVKSCDATGYYLSWNFTNPNSTGQIYADY